MPNVPADGDPRIPAAADGLLPEAVPIVVAVPQVEPEFVDTPAWAVLAPSLSHETTTFVPAAATLGIRE